MASAKVLKMQEHLEAGKRKSEFCRMKASEKAKKANSTSQVQVSDDIKKKRSSELEHVRLTDSSGVGTSYAHVPSRSELSGRASKIAANVSDILGKGEFNSSDTNAKSSFSARNNDIHAIVQENSYLNNEENRDTAASLGLDGFGSTKDKFESSKDGYGSSVQVASGVGNYHSSHYASPIQDHTTSHSTHWLDKYTLSNIN